VDPRGFRRIDGERNAKSTQGMRAAQRVCFAAANLKLRV
jgi:hypothetical protein